MHRFQKANLGRPFQAQCVRCERVLWAGDVESVTPHNQVWADLSGEAFKAYYCGDCKDWAEGAQQAAP